MSELEAVTGTVVQLLKASPNYQLTYYNQVQQKPAPLPVPSG